MTSQRDIQIDSTTVPNVRRQGRGAKALGLCLTEGNCPEVLEEKNGEYVLIGKDITSELKDNLPSYAGCGDDEGIVRIPRAVFHDAIADVVRQLLGAPPLTEPQ